MIVAVRIRGVFGTSKSEKVIMSHLGLVRPNYVGFYPDSMKETIRKVEHLLAWGEASEELEKKLEGKRKYRKNVYRLQPPKGGYKSTRLFYPKGDLGYRGKEIEKLVEKMLG